LYSTRTTLYHFASGQQQLGSLDDVISAKIKAKNQ
jgi:hypothetical protein